jgi:tetratricopeptide (TPR) repeat protein
MSANATNSKRMDCGTVAREEILENYLLGRLSEADREAFEEHYFECARCFDDLQTLQAIQGELRLAGAQFEAETTRPFLRWAPAAGFAAVLVLAVGVLLWTRWPAPPGSSEASKAQPPPRAQSPEKPRAEVPATSAASEPSLDQLARVDPPQYEPRTLRGATDEATARFQRGMEHYRKADYGGAVADLRAAAELDPDAAHSCFFLGISYLMSGQDSAAIHWLRATIALGDSAYLEEAHMYLAKAFLRRKDVRAAETELNKVVQLRGSSSGQARQLLSQLDRLKARSD